VTFGCFCCFLCLCSLDYFAFTSRRSLGFEVRIPLAKPVFDEEMRNAAVGALRNERFVLGESVFRFEGEFARCCGSRYAASTSSGASALRLSLFIEGFF